ncbi:MAG: DNRLRE domain-containing protein [Algisphaera sp.]
MNMKPFVLTTLGSLTLLTTSGVAMAEDVVLQPHGAASNDVSLYQGFPASNLNGAAFGGAFEGLLSATKTAGTGLPGHEIQSLLSFELPTDGQAVQGAQLRVYNLPDFVPFPIGAANATRPVDVSAYALSGAGFDDETATWAVSPYTRDAGLNPSNLGAAVDTVTVNATGAWFTLDVTAAVQAALANAQTTAGFALVSNTADWNGQNAAGLIAASGSYANAAFHPQLVLDVVPEPATASMLLAAGGLALLRRRR